MLEEDVHLPEAGGIMKRHAMALLSALLLAGCATTGSNYYGHEGSGDYYYGSPTADVYIDSPGYVRHHWSFNGGFGHGYGYPYSWWGYGYPPIWWQPLQPHDQPGVLRGERVERDRATRSALTRRDTVQAPASATRLQSPSVYPQPSAAPRVNADARLPPVPSSRAMVAPQPVAPPRPAAPVRSATLDFQPRSAPMRSSSPPPPTRSAPIPQKP